MGNNGNEHVRKSKTICDGETEVDKYMFGVEAFMKVGKVLCSKSQL